MFQFRLLRNVFRVKLQRVIGNQLPKNELKFSHFLKCFVLLPFVLFAYGCNGHSDSYSICGKAEPRINSAELPSSFVYAFTVNGVPFNITKSDLERFSINNRRVIMECTDPDIKSLRIKLPSDFSVGIKNEKMLSIVIIGGGRARVHNYQVPTAEHIRLEKDRLYLDKSLPAVPLMFKRGGVKYYCQFCNPFFGFPVILTEFGPGVNPADMPFYDSTSGAFTGDWGLQIQGGIIPKTQPKNIQQYSIVVYSSNIEFSDLPEFLINLESQIQAWME